MEAVAGDIGGGKVGCGAVDDRELSAGAACSAVASGPASELTLMMWASMVSARNVIVMASTATSTKPARVASASSSAGSSSEKMPPGPTGGHR